MCHKASAIGQKLTHLATLLLNQLQQEDASSGNKTDSTQQLHQDFDLMKIVDDVQSALRAGVSIQVRNFDGFFSQGHGNLISLFCYIYWLKAPDQVFLYL